MISIEHERIAAAVGAEPLGTGGQGAVYAVKEIPLNDGWQTVYKEYSAEFLPQVNGDDLLRMVGLRAMLPEHEGQWLYENTAWPAVVVTRDGAPCGFLMRGAPVDFKFVYNPASGGSGRVKLADFSFLLNQDAFMQSIGLHISGAEKLALLIEVAELIAHLHALHIVIGDLSPKNLLFARRPAPRVFLLDCDATRIRDINVLPQVETPDWRVPPGEERATMASDAYKFGLLVVRMLVGDQSVSDPDVLLPDFSLLHPLACRSLSAEPAIRPSVSEWILPLARTGMRELRVPATAAPAMAGTGAVPGLDPARGPFPSPPAMHSMPWWHERSGWVAFFVCGIITTVIALILITTL